VFTIAALARHSDLPRRTIQYWADHEVIVPLNPFAGGDAPRIFDTTELDLVRMLVPFTSAAVAIAKLKLVAEVFRLLIEDLGDADMHELLRPILIGARAGQPGFLLVECRRDDTVMLLGFDDPAALGRVAGRLCAERPTSAFTIINLTAVLAAPERGAAVGVAGGIATRD
jgi:hypothetical protein